MITNNKNKKIFNVLGFSCYILLAGVFSVALSGCSKTDTEQNKTVANTTQSQSAPAQEAKEISYKIFSTEDLSMKALGDKALSQYSASEVTDMPMDKRFSYNVLVAKNISKEDLQKTAEKVVSDMRIKDNDIDELTMNFYDSEKEMTPSGKAIWAPNGIWGTVYPELARSNNRASYKVELSFYEFGTSDSSREMTDKEREIYDFYYDSIANYQKEKGNNADVTVGSAFDRQIVSEITKKYSITEDEFEKILYKDR